MKVRSKRLIALVSVAAVASLGAWAAYAQEIYAGHYEQKTGQELYQSICQGCHMPDAQGAVGAGAYPALAHDAHLKAALYPVTRVIYGSKAMPGFGDALSDEQIANVVNYVRTHFGNHYSDAVTPAAVKAARP